MTRFAWSALALGSFAASLAACECTGEHDDLTEIADVEAPWLLAIDEDEGTIDALIQISVEPGAEGEVSVVCSDLELPTDFAPDTNFTSLAWHDGVLYASAARETWGDTLVRVDPCACTVSEIGPYGFTLASGLASRGGALFGVAADDDVLITVDPATADAEPFTPLPGDWGSHGLTPTGPNEGDRLYGLDASSDRLFRLGESPAPGSVATSEDFAAVGLEYHPGRERLYACGLRDRGDALVTIDPESGLVGVVADFVFTTDCDNLAGPGPIACTQ